ncbi:MAG: carbohydrate ABC transporter permease [Spirochaetaceae bacterium]|nr:carbohydrate ABC transporter permease [Spirochaetaceae bacterium]
MQKILLYIAVIVLLIYIISPFLWLIIMSISSSTDLSTKPLNWLPKKIDLSSYKELLHMGKNTHGESFLFGLRNSFITAITTVFISLLVTFPAAWVFSRYPNKRNIILKIAIVTFMLPPVAYALPIYKTLSTIGWLDNSFALAFVYCTLVMPFCAWLTKENMDAIPFELEESAIIDGAGLFTRLFKIVLPLMMPAIGTVALLALLMSWDEYFYAMLFTNSNNAITLPVVIANLASGRQANYGLIATGGVIAAAPPVIIGLLLQKSLISGLTAGGVKG